MPANRHWKNGEYEYCLRLVRQKGDDLVGRIAPNVVSYLHVQCGSALRDGEWETAARLGYAALTIGEVRNQGIKSAIRWDDALNALTEGLD